VTNAFPTLGMPVTILDAPLTALNDIQPSVWLIGQQFSGPDSEKGS